MHADRLRQFLRRITSGKGRFLPGGPPVVRNVDIGGAENACSSYPPAVDTSESEIHQAARLRRIVVNIIAARTSSHVQPNK